MKSQSQRLKEKAEKLEKERSKKAKKKGGYKSSNKLIDSAKKKIADKKKKNIPTKKLITFPKLVTESTPLSVSRKAALNAYVSKKALIEKASSTKKILEIVNEPLWYDEIFSLDPPKNTRKKIDISGDFSAQQLVDQLECDPETPTIKYSEATLSQIKVNNSKINDVQNLMNTLKNMNSNLEKNGVVTDNSVINQLEKNLVDLQKEQQKIINDECLVPPAEEVMFSDADYTCSVPQKPNPFVSIPDEEIPPVTAPDIKYPTDFPKDCYDQIENGMKSIVSDSIKFGNSIQKIEQLRKRYYLTKVIYDLEASNLKLYKKIVNLMNLKKNSLAQYGKFYLSDAETLALFDHKISNMNLSVSSNSVTKDINKRLEVISKDYDFKTNTKGSLVFPSFTIKKEPSGIDWFADKIFYEYFDSKNISGGKLDAYFLFIQSEPTESDKASFEKDSSNSTKWIKKRDEVKKKLLTEIDNIVDSITKPIIKSNLTLFFSKFRKIELDENFIPRYVNVFDAGIKSYLEKEIKSTESRIAFYLRYVDEFNSLDKLQSEFADKMKKKVKELTTIPCLASAPDSKSDNKFPDRNDEYYQANPTMPFLDKLSYWKKFAGLATIAGLVPTNWSYGLVIPNPSGLTGVSMPIVWLPIAVIPTPIGVYVIFIGQCGVMPAPYVYNFSGVSMSSGFLISLRGSSDFVKLKPALIRAVTKSMVPGGILKQLLKLTDMHLDVPNLKFESISDQKKFIEFPSSSPLSNPKASAQVAQTAAFSSVLPGLLQAAQKAAFGIGKSGTKGLGSSILDQIFIQDDLPPFDRLSVTNIPFMLYAGKFASIGSYCGGIPLSVPSSPKISQSFPSALKEIPETFL